jgi:curved DNA-binding protein
MIYKDYYAALGLQRTAGPDEIKKAYRKLARSHHPDMSKATGAEERFKEVAEAYATLKDPAKRAAYDELGHPPNGNAFQPSAAWQNDFGANGQAFDDIDLAELLSTLSRRQAASGTQFHPMKGRDYETATSISLEDARRGSTIHLSFSDRAGERTFEVKIPSGVCDKQKLRLRGKGEKGLNGGVDGDVYLTVNLAPHAVFRPDGLDVYFDLFISPWEAALGSAVEVPTLDGPLEMTIPAGTRAGHKLRLRGRGLAPNASDLFAIVQIDIPGLISPQEADLYRALASASSFNPQPRLSQEAKHA